MVDKILLVGICDDEEAACMRIEKAVKESIRRMNISVSVECCLFQDGKELYEESKKKEFDLLFIDIEMPDMDGFQLVKKISIKKERLHFIFVSAHESFVFDAQEYMPLWFVRKTNLEKDMLRALRKYFEKVKPQRIFFQFRSKAKVQGFYLQEILYIESEGHLLHIRKTNGRMTTQYGSLKALEEEWSEYDFLRIHKSYLVNQRYIEKVGGKEVILKDGTVLEMGRDRKKSVCHAMSQYERKYYG